MHRIARCAIAIVLLIGVLLAGCARNPLPERAAVSSAPPDVVEAAPTRPASATPEQTRAAASTATLLPITPSVLPTTADFATRTPLPAQTATPTPVPLLTGTPPQDGPWAVVPSENGIWAMRADGTDPVLLTTGTCEPVAAAPRGGLVACVTRPGQNNPYDALWGYQLKIIHFPSGEIQTITSLDMPGIGLESSDEARSDAFEATRAYDLEWSPDGKYLAFTSPHAGNSSDVFVYAVSTGEIRRLTDGASHATDLSWSPDGRYIFHTGVRNFGTGAGANMAGAWVVSIDGQETYKVIDSQDHSGNERLLEWVNNDIILVSTWNLICGDGEMRTVNIKNGETRMLWKNCFKDYIYDRGTGEILLTSTAEYDFFGESAPGLYLVQLGQDGAKKLSDERFDYLFAGDADHRWFAGKRDAGLFSVDPNSKVEPFLPNPDMDLRYATRISSDTWIWSWDNLYIVRDGKPKEILLFNTSALVRSPFDPDLFFIGYSPTRADENSSLYTVRFNSWEPRLISDQITNPWAVLWVEP